jgi:hypothetical protein
VTAQTSDGPPAGVVRLLNTAGGRVLCLAGAVDEANVERFVQRYGREPARIDAIDAVSVTSLSPTAAAFVVDHLDAAATAGRPVVVRCSPRVGRMLARAAGPSRGRS